MWRLKCAPPVFGGGIDQFVGPTSIGNWKSVIIGLVESKHYSAGIFQERPYDISGPKKWTIWQINQYLSTWCWLSGSFAFCSFESVISRPRLEHNGANAKKPRYFCDRCGSFSFVRISAVIFFIGSISLNAINLCVFVDISVFGHGSAHSTHMSICVICDYFCKLNGTMFQRI